jgi:hypothetical protein
LAEADWHRYQLVCSEPEAAAAIDARNPEAAHAADLAAIERQRTCIACLDEVVRWQPDNARAQVDLAQSHLRLFDLLQSTAVNAMPLAQLRDAAVQSRFGAREELTAWLARAVGEHWRHLEDALRHAQRAVSLCPMEGSAHVYLGELAFLDGDRGDSQKACIEQALRLRPFDGEVLYAAAMESLMAGDVEGYVQQLQRSYRAGRVSRQRILRELVARSPEESLDPLAEFVMATYSPSVDDLWFLHSVAADRVGVNAGSPSVNESLTAVRRRVAAAMENAAAAVSGAEAARHWLGAARLYALIHDGPRALPAARNAYACDPNNYDVRYALAESLLAERLPGEAEQHFHWCLQRKPDDATLADRYRQALGDAISARPDRPESSTAAAKESEGRR